MKKENKRLSLLDFLRGLAIVDMVVFHYLDDIYVVSGNNVGWASQQAVHLWQQWGLSAFVLVSGMACTMMNESKMLWRGLQLNVLGLLITMATMLFMPSERIIFGVLNFFGCALWLPALLRLSWRGRITLRANVVCVLLALCVVAWFTFSDVQQGVLHLGPTQVQLPAWMHTDAPIPFGLRSAGFYSADYVPLLPHIFVLWGGALLMMLLQRYCPKVLMLGDFAPLTFCGRHSLIIYLVHQPVLLFVLGLF